ncbi:flavodoxin-dependent (E)-4-hydroxy-3-methylbut-2-enyl-diphosphate synthase [bacterium]|nr:flavodoxin-dependent (E)-4-hydroxy-3-methylbut-2-enyl-diphosphate synthase [bacterium]
MRKSRVVNIGNVILGGGAPLRIQSMTNTKTTDVRATVDQILQLEEAGCEIVRVAVPDEASASAISDIKKAIHIPLVADIHFDYRLALQCLEAGVDKLRINPGNIGAAWKVKEVALSAKDKGIPIRIGVNSGSLPRKIIKDHEHPTAAMMLAAAEKEVEILDSLNFSDIVVSLKSSEVNLTIDANRKFASEYDYPIHLGVTEAGFGIPAIVKSVLGIGVLLEEGIGDTFRVSMTGDPVEEIRVGKELMKALGKIEEGITIISCPTCARAEFPVLEVARELERRFSKVQKPITVAVMGCVVNGPGEARGADIGVTGSNQQAVIFRRGIIVEKTSINDIIDRLGQLVEAYIENE